MSRGRKGAVLATACLAVLLIAVDATVLSLAIPQLSEDLRPSGTEILWIGDIYSFVLAGLLVTMGNVGDRIGRRRLLLIGTVAFGAASAVAAYAPTPELLIAARALLGLAGATLMPSTLSIIRNVFTEPRERTTAIGIWSAMAAAGMAIGPVAGGLLLDHFWWGSVFLINLPVMALVLVIGAMALPESRDPNAGRLDPSSVVLSAAGIVGIVYAIKEAAFHGVGAGVIAAGVVGVAALAWFLRRQRGLADPLLDVALFRRSGFSAAVVSDLLAVFTLAGLMFFLSQYLQFVLGQDALEAGLRQAPTAVAAMLAAPAAGLLVTRIGRAACIAGGLGLTAAGLLPLLALDVSGHYLPLAVTLTMAGGGIGLALTVTADTILTAVPKDKAGAASAVSETAYELGTALGIAFLGSLLGAVYRSSLDPPAGLSRQAAAAAEESVAGALEAASSLPGGAGAALSSAARAAFVDGMHVIAVVAAAILVVAAIAAAFTLRGAAAPVGDRDEVVRTR